MSLLQISYVLLLAIVVVCVIIDWRTTKIPNVITFPAALVGIFLNYMMSGWNGALHAVLAWLLGAVIIVALAVAPVGPKYAGAKIGMGDAKLIAAIGAFLGIKDVILVVLYFCICYGLLSLIKMALKVPWKQVALRLKIFMVASSDVELPPVDTTDLTAVRTSPMPISLAVLMGLALTLAFRQETLAFLGWH
jgi:Flp pilus assembly protein protease CpaA